MERQRPHTGLIGIAGVHYVVSELSRRGLVALPTIRNTAGITHGRQRWVKWRV